MRPERALIADRLAAQHSPVLLRAASAVSGDTLPGLALGCERLTRVLAAALGRFSGGDAPQVSCSAPRATTMGELAGGIAPLAANSLLGVGAKATPFLASMEAGVVLRLVDRAFGGRGGVPDPLPRAFPVSAELLIGRLETIVAGALAGAFGLAGDDAIRTLRRDGSLAQVTPFAPSEALTLIALTVSDPGEEPWTITLALPAPALGALLHSDAGAVRASTRRLPRGNAIGPAFAELPLTVRAVLVDMSMPFARVSRLRVGDILPVAVARSVPLRVGTRTIAHGTIGALDDRVAVQLTQAFA